MESEAFIRAAEVLRYEMAKDPVCGMQVSEPAHLKSEHMGQTFYFCSQQCKSSFDSSPMKYTGGHDAGMGHH